MIAVPPGATLGKQPSSTPRPGPIVTAIATSFKSMEEVRNQRVQHRVSPHEHILAEEQAAPETIHENDLPLIINPIQKMPWEVAAIDI